MKLPELYQGLQAALAAPLNPDDLTIFTNHAKELTALTTWAPGLIDPQGQACAISIALEGKNRSLYEAGANDSLAELHDALLDLRSAIIQHDEDRTPSKDSGQDDVDF